MSTARKKNKTTNVTRRISPKDRFFKELELECVVFMNYHSECSISARSNTIFEKGADKLFNKKYKLIVANSANQPGFIAYGNSSNALKLRNIAFKNIRQKARKTVVKRTISTTLNPIIEHMQFLEQIKTQEPNEINLTFTNQNDPFIQELSRFIREYNETTSAKKQSQIKEKIHSFISEKIESYKIEIQKIQKFIENKPFKKLNNIYKQTFQGRSTNDTDSFGTVICLLVSEQLMTAIQYYIEDTGVVEFSDPMHFIDFIYSDQNFILRENNYLYNFIHYLFGKTKNLKVLPALNSLSQNFDDLTETKTTNSKELVRFLSAFIKFSNIILLNSSCLGFAKNLKQTKIDEINALASNYIASSESTEVASSPEFEQQLDFDLNSDEFDDKELADIILDMKFDEADDNDDKELDNIMFNMQFNSSMFDNF
jgi:hypothetical protein